MEYFVFPDRESQFREEVMAEKKSMKSLQKSIQELLKEAEYDGIYSFFEEVLSYEYDYIILMSRRCLVLYQIFMLFFILDEKNFSSSATVLSDHAFPFYYKQMQGKKIAIVDDILIHGRTISNLYDTIIKYCPTISPTIHIYMSDLNNNCLRDEIKKNMHSFCVAYQDEWRNLSNKIVNCIFVSNTPYTSFVTAFFQYNSYNLLTDLKQIPSLSIIENTDYTQNLWDTKSFFCCENNWNKKNIFSSLSLGECIRIYWNSKVHKLTVIPYVFIKNIKIDQSQTVFKEIADVLPDTFVKIKEIFLENSIEDEEERLLISYKMRLLTCILSNLYWRNFKERFQLKYDYYIDIDTLDKSFGIAIANELQEILFADLGGLCNFEFDIKKISDDNDSFKDILNDVCNSNSNVAIEPQNFLKRYFQKAWYEDERLASIGQDRHPGLLIEQFMDSAKNIIPNNYQVLSYLVNAWDIGVATANYAVDKRKSVVGCFVTPGEQSYKLILEEYPFIMSSLIFVSKLIQPEDAKKDNFQFEKYRETKLLELLDIFKKKYILHDYEDIKNIICDNHGYLGSWDQVSVIREAIKRDCIQDDNIVKEFIDKNFNTRG